jgi:hypothetical protein
MPVISYHHPEFFSICQSNSPYAPPRGHNTFGALRSARRGGETTIAQAKPEQGEDLSGVQSAPGTRFA